MITLHVNGEEKRLPENTTVEDALQQWGYQCHEIAVAVNNEFVPRSQYPGRILSAAECVDIVAPVQGG